MEQQSQVRIIVVDDQILVREGLRRVFEAVEDLSVVAECGDGDEVVAVVRSTQADIVLMDMRMKRVDGATALQLLTALPEHPPVLVLTTYDDADTLGRALYAGADGFLLKESVGLDLMRAVRTVAGGGAWIDPAIASMVLSVYRGGSPASPRIEIQGLTDREVEVLRLMALGRTNGEIAEELFIAERTVKTHVGHLFTKLEVRDRVAAVLRAYEFDVVDRPA